MASELMFALGKIWSPELILPEAGLAYIQVLELLTMVEKVVAPVELASVIDDEGYVPLPVVKLQEIGLGLAVRFPVPTPDPTVNVTLIVDVVPPVGVMVTVPVYWPTTNTNPWGAPIVRVAKLLAATE